MSSHGIPDSLLTLSILLPGVSPPPLHDSAPVPSLPSVFDTFLPRITSFLFFACSPLGSASEVRGWPSLSFLRTGLNWNCQIRTCVSENRSRLFWEEEPPALPSTRLVLHLIFRFYFGYFRYSPGDSACPSCVFIRS